MQVYEATVSISKGGTGRTLAVKQASKCTPGGLIREAKALCRIHAAHGGSAPNIVPLSAIVAQQEPHTRPPPPDRPTFRTAYVRALLMPVFSSDLFTFLQQPDIRLTSAERWRTAQQLITGLLAAKAAGVAHGDIKPHNVLRRSNGDVCISDFGFAVCGQDAAAHCTESCGTPLYMAPEVLLCVHERKLNIHQPYDAFAADVWALGITFTQLALPRLWRALLRGSPRNPGGWPDARRRVLRAVKTVCEPRMVHLITRALAARPVLRATLEELRLVAAVGAAEACARESAAACAQEVAEAEARLREHCGAAGGRVEAPNVDGDLPYERSMHSKHSSVKPRHARPVPLPEDARVWDAEAALVREVERLFPSERAGGCPGGDGAMVAEWKV